MPPTPRPPIVPCWLTVRYHRVEVEINDQVATTRVDQVFANETGRDLEGTYVFPLPESATVTGFSMWVDGQRQDGEVLTREEARRLYESIVRRNRDPALLEYVGRGAFQARVFPVPAGGERRLQLEYTQALASEGDVLRYVYPLNTERFSARPLQQAAVSVTLRSARPLKAIYSPSHEVSVVRQGENEAQVSWEAANVRPREDFELVFGVSPDPVGLHLLTHRPAGEDGYFLLLAAPAVRGPERPGGAGRDPGLRHQREHGRGQDGAGQGGDALRAQPAAAGGPLQRGHLLQHGVPLRPGDAAGRVGGAGAGPGPGRAPGGDGGHEHQRRPDHGPGAGPQGQRPECARTP